MGDRICLMFKYENEYSPVLYAHWDGMSLVDEARRFFDNYKDKVREEPSNWMVNFLMYLREGKILDGGYYLYNKGDECSPDDNGRWIFDLATGEYYKVGSDWEERE